MVAFVGCSESDPVVNPDGPNGNQGVINPDDIKGDDDVIAVYVTVFDYGTKDLLDPRDASNFLGNDIRLIYKGKEYPIGSEVEGGMKFSHNEGEMGEPYYLKFGNFDPSVEYRSETFQINWGYGNEIDNFEFDYYKTENGVKQELRVNGEVVSENALKVKFDKDSPTYDFWNLKVEFAVTSEDGKDLLDPAVEGNIMANGIKVLYNDTVYEVQECANLHDLSGLNSRASFVHPLALRYGRYIGIDGKPETTYRLSFGEFDPTLNFKNEKFTIDWGDGTTNEVDFDAMVEWKGWEPLVTINVRLDGVEADWMINLVR